MRDCEILLQSTVNVEQEELKSDSLRLKEEPEESAEDEEEFKPPDAVWVKVENEGNAEEDEEELKPPDAVWVKEEREEGAEEDEEIYNLGDETCTGLSAEAECSNCSQGELGKFHSLGGESQSESSRSTEGCFNSSREKRIVCPTCGRGFSRKDHLVYHMRTHTGEKTEECSVCRRGFSRKAHLVYHMRKHAGE